MCVLALHKKKWISIFPLELGSTCSKSVEIGKVDRNLIILYCKQLNTRPPSFPPSLPYWVGRFKELNLLILNMIRASSRSKLKKSTLAVIMQSNPSRGSRRYQSLCSVEDLYRTDLLILLITDMNTYGEGDIFLFLSWSSFEKKRASRASYTLSNPVLGGVIGINHNQAITYLASCWWNNMRSQYGAIVYSI